MPLPRALALGRGLGWVFGSVVRYRRRDAVEALARGFPDKTPREIRGIVRSMYAHLGTCFVEFCRLGRRLDEYVEDLIEWDGEERVRDAMGEGKGLLVLTGHVGNWELLGAFSRRMGHPMTVIVKRIKNAAVNDFWFAERGQFGPKYVPSRNAYRPCLAALKRNEIVGFILDQNMRRSAGIFVDFFGRPACTSPGLAYLSHQSGAAVIPVFLVRQQGGRHRVYVGPAIEPPPDRTPETIRAYTQRYTRVIENAIREHPEQWIWVHRRWRTPPEGDASTSPATGEEPG